MFYLINRFTVHGDTDEFLAILAEINAYMKTQPGFRFHRLYRSVNEPNVFVETAEWEERELHKAAISSDRFLEPVKKIRQHATAEPGPFELVRESTAAAVD
ncbi:antibiotic biosynthesis monooxygenase family protein [Amycolatopsis sp. NPDC059090]|uniref:antibiotic biosynthesis monooxygenase family protein n=1 Tax=unclassified Amycolatopsis TaxID=2618356 RepID=UPI00366F2655